MIAKELRCNNYVDFMGVVRKVTPMFILEQRQSDLANQEYLKPIPLTEDWLLRMGFERQEENNSYQLDTNFGVSFWGRDGVINTYCESNEFGNEMKYVHEIQNRFHSLSGAQELTIKE